jgi:integrase
MFALQKLLTHKSPVMTQRYSHLRDDALKRASNVIADIFKGKKEVASNNVVELNK